IPFFGISNPLPFYFNYVPNSKLEPADLAQSDGKTPAAFWPDVWTRNTLRNADRVKTVRFDSISRSSDTIIMLEMRSTANEFDDPGSGGNPIYPDGDFAGATSINRAKAHWSRMANRHSDGLNFVFADGHAAFAQLDYADEELDQDFVDPRFPGRNKPDLIWAPFAAANDD
ncbi:MAG: H-X9-DG-CTERM domain-containing protein, partial [Planctomycetota bacterium]